MNRTTNITIKSLPSVAGQPGIPTLNRWFDIWMNTYKLGRIKPTTMDTYRALYDRHIRNSIGMHTLDEFHPIHIQKIYNDFLNKGYSPKYLSTLHTMLNNMFKKALANELISSNPCALTDRPGLDISEHRVLSLEEQQALCEHMKRPRFRHIEPAVTTLLGTGLRIGELLALRWSDIHIAENNPETYGIPDPVNFLTVRHTLVRVKNEGIPGSHFLLQSPKTKSSLRSIPLQDCVVEALRRQQKLQLEYRKKQTWSPYPGFEGLVFCGRHGQPQWRSTIVANINTIVDSYNKTAEKPTDATIYPASHIDHILPHAFRHTFATRSLEAGIPPKVVQHWLGHASIKMTLDLYTHVSHDLSAQYMHLLEASTANPSSAPAFSPLACTIEPDDYLE